MSNAKPPDSHSSWLEPVLKTAEGLPPPLRFTIVFGALVVLVVVSQAAVPDNLVPLLYLLFGGGAVLYAWWEWQQSRERREARQAQAREPQPLSEPAQRPATPTVLQPVPTSQPPAAAANLSAEEWRRRYLADLALRCEHLSMASIDRRASQSGAAQLALQSVFTELDVAARPEWGEEEGGVRGGVRGRVKGRGREEGEEGREAALAAISREERLVLLGKPGSGKSTLVNFMGLCLAGEGLGRADVNVSRLSQQGWRLPGLLPVRVILRDYATRGLPAGQGLWHFVVGELEATRCDEGNLGDFAPTLRSHLRQQGGLLLLDGLDEVPEAHLRRGQLRQAILDFRRDFPRVRIVVTSRPYAYDNPAWQLPGFARADLLDFSPEQIKTYIERWYTATADQDKDLSPERAVTFTKQLQQEVERNPNLAELAPRPLLLALMVSLHRWRGGGALPQRREELYDESVKLLLDLWQRPKQLYEDGQPTRLETSALVELGLDLESLRKALSEIAFRAHRDQPTLAGTADVPGEVLAGVLYKAPGRKPDVSLDRIITYVKDRAGLLEDRGPGPGGDHLYTFPHRTFQEYLAACHLLDLDTFPDDLVELACDDLNRWREAALLAASRANSPVVVWGLVDALCPSGQPPAGGWAAESAWRGAFLAGQVLVETGLTDSSTTRHADKLERVRAWLLALVTEGQLASRDRAAAGAALGQLGDPRLAVVTVDGMELCQVAAGPFWLGSDEQDDERPLRQVNLAYDYWLGRYPVTHAQFQVFVADGGYTEGRYWPEARAAGFWSTAGFKGRYDSGPRRGPAVYSHPFDLPNHPVVGVSWYEALAFSRWLTERWRKKGALPAGWSVTLPSEAEWEKAARGGGQIPVEPVITAVAEMGGKGAGEQGSRGAGVRDNPEPQRRYPWLGADDPNKANGEETGIGTTSAVGCFAAGASVYGCQELSGNVWEWTRSLYQPYPYVATDGRENLAAGPDNRRVIRGGAYYSDSSRRRFAYRDRLTPDYFFDRWGFRVAVSPFLHL